MFKRNKQFDEIADVIQNYFYKTEIKMNIF